MSTPRALAACLLLALAPPAAAAPVPPPGVAAVPGLSPSVDGGFHMEPRPVVDDVFGDGAEYRKAIDRCLSLGEGMARTREQFTRAAQAILADLAPGAPPGRTTHDGAPPGRTTHDGAPPGRTTHDGAPPGRTTHDGAPPGRTTHDGAPPGRTTHDGAPPGRTTHAARTTPSTKCPEAAVAEPYARARELGGLYLRSGRELTRHVEAVRELDRLGESAGLTPDYRQKVKRVLGDYSSHLADYREMKAAFHDQLTAELRFAGCDPDRLLARAGASATVEGWSAAAPSGEFVDGTSKVTSPPAPAVPAPVGPAAPPGLAPTERSGILFYVDNSRCPGASQVQLDGRPLGRVPPATRSAFQAAPGPHDLCLLPEASPRRCGDAGTMRRSYLHEGWTVSLRCD